MYGLKTLGENFWGEHPKTYNLQLFIGSVWGLCPA